MPTSFTRNLIASSFLALSLAAAAPVLAKSRGFETTINAPISSAVKVEVVIGDELAHRAENLPTKLRDRSNSRRLNAGFANNGYYGEKDVARLAERLQSKLEKRLVKKGITVSENAPAVLRVTLTDAKPNRPTFTQLSKEPSLSSRSFALGGAEMEAELIAAGGTSLGTMSYRYFEDDIRFASQAGIWVDAHRAMDRFANRASKTLSH